MKHSFSYLAILIVLFYAFQNAYIKYHDVKKPDVVSKTNIQHTAAQNMIHTNKIQFKIGTQKYTKQYITYIINHGSQNLHFKKDEVMEKGFVSPKDAPEVACYVMTLAGDKCDYSYGAPMLYTSNCAGCHGNNGKGLHGTYPDLTRRPLLGLAKE